MAGSRYGVKIRKQENKVKVAQKQAHECPSCGKMKVSRTSTGIFSCASCKTVFAGGAYVPKTGAATKQQKQQAIVAASAKKSE